jgi:hypothetical protein
MDSSKIGSGRRRWTAKQRSRLLARFHQSQLTLKQFAGINQFTPAAWIKAKDRLAAQAA